tara:strand:- start:283 stop:675 length:393 start_codon:yes stop_codon:yes gene_type:complete
MNSDKPSSQNLERDQHPAVLLYLFKRDFVDAGKRYFCPHCLRIEGLMALFPEIRHAIEVRYVAFAKPRGQLAEWVGDDQQSCPQLIFVGGDDSLSAAYSQRAPTGTLHITRTNDILSYLIARFKLPQIHP